MKTGLALRASFSTFVAFTAFVPLSFLIAVFLLRLLDEDARTYTRGIPSACDRDASRAADCGFPEYL